MEGQSLPIKESIKSLDTYYDDALKALKNREDACEEAMIVFGAMAVIGLGGIIISIGMLF